MQRISLLILLTVAIQEKAAATAAFEVASIKYAGPFDGEARPLRDRGGPGTADPEHLVLGNHTLIGLLGQAYGLSFEQIIGPKWLDSWVYTVEAKLPQGALRADAAEMLRDLLKAHFHIAAHHESRDTPGYELVVHGAVASSSCLLVRQAIPCPAHRRGQPTDRTVSQFLLKVSIGEFSAQPPQAKRSSGLPIGIADHIWRVPEAN